MKEPSFLLLTKGFQLNYNSLYQYIYNSCYVCQSTCSMHCFRYRSQWQRKTQRDCLYLSPVFIFFFATTFHSVDCTDWKHVGYIYN